MLSPSWVNNFAISVMISRDGVMSPLNPITSTCSALALAMICSLGTITPMSITSYPLQASTTPTMFFPMSCTSPFTVANRIFFFAVDSPLFFCSNNRGSNIATACFMTRADFTTWGKNILPLPKYSPTMFIPAISGPSMMANGDGYFCMASLMSSAMCVGIPLINASANLCSSGIVERSMTATSF